MQIKNIAGFAFGPITSAFLGLITVPVIAWLFSPEDVGRINIFQLALTFGLLFSMLGLDQAYVREYHEIRDREQLLLVCFLPGFIFLVASGLFSLAFSKELSIFLYEDDNPFLYLITYLAILILYITRFLSLILRMEERGWAYSISQVVPKILQIFLLACLGISAVKREFIVLQMVLVISMISVLFFYTWYTRNQWLGALKKNINLVLFKKLMKYGAPIIFADIAFWGLTATSSLALKSWSSLEELAVYSVATSFAAVAIVLQSIFTVVWAPAVYKWVAQGVDMIVVDKVAIQGLAVVSIVIAIASCFSWSLDFLLPIQYHSVKYILLCTLIQPLLYTLSEITCVGIGIERRTSFTIWITLLAMAVNMMLSYFLVPKYGATGASIANALAFTVFFFARTEVSARVWRNFPRLKIYLIVTLLISFSVISSAIGHEFPYYFYMLSPLLLFLVACYFHRQWKEIYIFIANKNI